MKKEKISLYIPCYNSEKYINECLKGIMNQTYPIDEILVIDDGSNDSTAYIASKYPVKFITNSENKGLAASRNIAFRESKNNFVVALDADCVPEPDWLEKLIKDLMDETVTGSGGMLIEKYHLNSADKWRGIHLQQHWGKNIIYNPPFLYGCNTIFKKNHIKEIGLYNEFYRNNNEDVDLSQRLLKNGYNLIYNPNAIVEHIRRDTVISIITTSWKWFFWGLPVPDKMKNIFSKTIRNFRKSISFLSNDIKNKYFSLLLIDILFPFYHILLDFKFYKNKHTNGYNKNNN